MKLQIHDVWSMELPANGEWFKCCLVCRREERPPAFELWVPSHGFAALQPKISCDRWHNRYCWQPGLAVWYYLVFFPTISDRFKGIHQQCVLGVCGGGRVGGAGGLNQENFSFYFSPFFILNLKFFFFNWDNGINSYLSSNCRAHREINSMFLNAQCFFFIGHYKRYNMNL